MLSERHRPRVRRALAVLGVVGAAVSSVALAPVATAAAAPIVSDGFSHAMKTGWGSANVGGDWKIYPRKKFAEITDGVAALRLRGADTGVEAIATGAAVRDVSGTFDFALSKASQGSVFVSFIARRTAASDVRVRVGMAPGGALTVSAAAREGTVERLVASPVTLSGQTFTAGAPLRLEVVVTGAPSTTLKARLYAPSATPPSTWPLSVTSSSVPTSAGAVGVHAFAGESSQGTRLMKIDNVLVVPPSTGGTTTPDPVPSDSTPPSAATPDSSGLTVPSGAKFVATWGNDANDGSQERPWKTVTKAVKTVPSGGTVVLRAGSYHEDVEVPIYKPVRIQAYPDEQVWFDGSSVVTSWTRSGNVWSTPWTTAFDHSDPTHALVDTKNYPLAAYPEQVWVGGVALTQVGSASAVKAGTFYVDSSAKKILMGTDPSSGEVRLATLSDALFVNYGKGSQILGIGFRRFATSISRMGAVKLYADEGVVRGCAFVDNAFAGLSLRGTRITVSDSGFAGNGQLGVQADRSDNLVLSELFVQRNNVQGFRVDQAAGGVKITHSRTVTIRNSLITKNIGSGLWIDQSSKGAVVVGNRLTENTRHGMVFEISAGLVFAGNRAERNGDAGINVLESGTVKIFNNVFISNYKGINVLDGDRLATRNLSAPELDDRYPLPDPLVTWEVRDVSVQGNVVSADGAERFLIGYDDARKANSARSRNVAANYNAYHRTSSGASTYFAAWGDWPTKMLAASTLSQFRSLAGQESAGTAADASSNPYIGSDGVGTSVSPWSPGLPSDVASAVGVSTGASLRAGLPRALP